MESKRITEVSKAVLERFNGDLEKVIWVPLKDVMTTLIEITELVFKSTHVLPALVAKNL